MKRRACREVAERRNEPEQVLDLGDCRLQTVLPPAAILRRAEKSGSTRAFNPERRWTETGPFATMPSEEGLLVMGLKDLLGSTGVSLTQPAVGRKLDVEPAACKPDD